MHEELELPEVKQPNRPHGSGGNLISQRPQSACAGIESQNQELRLKVVSTLIQLEKPKIATTISQMPRSKSGLLSSGSNQDQDNLVNEASALPCTLGMSASGPQVARNQKLYLASGPPPARHAGALGGQQLEELIKYLLELHLPPRHSDASPHPTCTGH